MICQYYELRISKASIIEANFQISAILKGLWKPCAEFVKAIYDAPLKLTVYAILS